MLGTSCPKSVSTQVYMLDRKIWKLFRTRAKKDKLWSVLLSNIRFLWFLQSMFLLSYLYQWFCWQLSKTKPMAFLHRLLAYAEICDHSLFTLQFRYRLKNKHIGELGTNVATISWLHWSPLSGYMITRTKFTNSLSLLYVWEWVTVLLKLTLLLFRNLRFIGCKAEFNGRATTECCKTCQEYNDRTHCRDTNMIHGQKLTNFCRELLTVFTSQSEAVESIMWGAHHQITSCDRFCYRDFSSWPEIWDQYTYQHTNNVGILKEIFD